MLGVGCFPSVQGFNARNFRGILSPTEAERENRGAGDGPELLKPFIEFVLGNHAQAALFLGRLAVAARLALHEDEFDVVLDDGVWLVGFAEEFRAVAHFVAGVGNLVPDDWIQVVETELAALHADVRMKRHDGVSSIVVAPRQADIAYDTD